MRAPAALMLAAGLAACGVKGPPQAPTEASAEAVAPRPAPEGAQETPSRFETPRRGRRAGPAETAAP